jgi:cytochrome d ubiquinol oxidase subunit I
MDIIELSRWQFAATTIYHFFFVPITLGMVWMLTYMEFKYVKTGDEDYKKMTKFWGKLFLINFAIGVATGIVQEFQFGMNWSEYSRFVGDIFGAPLALEALLAFFLESTFLGMWIFGWDKMSPKAHARTMLVVAIGSNLSAFWILVANSFMQNPVGFEFVEATGRAEMTDFLALITNPHVMLQFPHVIAAGLSAASFIIMGISAWHLYVKKNNITFLDKSFKMSVWVALFSSLAVGGIGHAHAQDMFHIQPMKMAAAEAVYETENPAGLSLFSIIDEENRKEVFSIRVPNALSLLLYNKPTGEVKGMNQLQAEFEKKYGPGDYIPPVHISYWSFRAMVGAGTAMIGIALLALFFVKTGREITPLMGKILLASALLPIIGTTSGWILTEVGRQPWIVYGLLKVKDAVSPTLTAGEVWFSLIGFVLLYGTLMAVSIKLAKKAANEVENTDSAGEY